MGEKYLTIKLTLTQLNKVKPEQIEKAQYRARIEQSPLGASRGPGWDFKLNAKDWEMINKFIARMPTKTLSKPDVIKLGQKLFSLIFKVNDENGNVVLDKYNQCLGRLTDGVRLRLAIAILAEPLVSIPWEYLHDGNGFLLQNHLIVRIIDELAERKAPFGPIQRVLVAIANPGSEHPEEESDFAPFDAHKHKGELVRLLTLAGMVADTDYEVITATRPELERKLRDEPFDALYFIGHGIFTPDLEGQLILENSQNGVDPLDASELAQWLSNPSGDHRVRFAYLNSCSTAKTDSPNPSSPAKTVSANPFAGVAQRLMRDGDVDAVVAMQTNVEQTAALDIAVGFFDELRRGKSPENAMALARKKAGDAHSWGVPVIYSYLGGPEEFDKNRIACLLSADIVKSSYGLFLPTFVYGIPTENAKQVKVSMEPPDSYNYKGDTLALKDTEAAWDVIRLVTRIAPSEKIELWRVNDYSQAECSHWLFFGSKSNKIVESFVKEPSYSSSFRFYYKNHPNPQYSKQWVLEDVNYDHRLYPIDDPSSDESGEYEKKEDIGIIEKIIDRKAGRVFFLISGLGDRATRGCGNYFYENWEDLLEEFGGKQFGIILRFPGGLEYNFPRRINRETGQTS